MVVTKERMEQLTSFGISAWTEVSQGTPAVHLLDEDLCRSFIQQYMLDINAPNQRIAASLFMKQYARLTIAAVLYHISEYNTSMTLPIRSCLYGKDRKLHIHPETCDWKEWDNCSRMTWFYDMITPLFAEHLTPMISMLQQTTSLSPKILWENVAVRINSFYRQLLIEKQENSNHVHEDFLFLKEASGELFQLNENPLTPFLHLDTETHIRHTCCTYYLMGKHEYCGVCPLQKTSSL